MRIILFLCAFSYCAIAASQEAAETKYASIHPLYLGLAGGFGSTTWEGLVPTVKNQNMAMRTSTPLKAKEGGSLWGFFAGYEFTPYFALEGGYMRYPNAKISFDEESMFAFDNSGTLNLHTKTETASIMAKIMLAIPRTDLRVYSGFGVAQIHRWDALNENRRASATFGLGVNFNITEHIMAELAANYTAGYGESELNPAMDYVPFLYSGFLKLAYRV